MVMNSLLPRFYLLNTRYVEPVLSSNLARQSLKLLSFSCYREPEVDIRPSLRARGGTDTPWEKRLSLQQEIPIVSQMDTLINCSLIVAFIW